MGKIGVGGSKKEKRKIVKIQFLSLDYYAVYVTLRNTLLPANLNDWRKCKDCFRGN